MGICPDNLAPVHIQSAIGDGEPIGMGLFRNDNSEAQTNDSRKLGERIAGGCKKELRRAGPHKPSPER